MDMFKKIYNTLIVMFILSLLYIALIVLGAIDISLTDKTSMYMLAIAIDILGMTFLFSRSANVIANRNARIVGYIATFVGLVNLLLTALQLILEDASSLYEISNFMSHITIFLFLIVMVYEIPQSNTAHGKFQNMTAFIIAITAIFPYITGLKDFNSNISLKDLTSLTSYSTNQVGLDQSKKDNVEILEKVNTILTFLSIGTFLINPMLRVHYIDRDYVALHETDDIYNTAIKYQANTQPDPYQNLSDKYKKDVVQQQPIQTMAIPIPPPTIGELSPSVVEDIPREKVVNQQFKPEEIPEAIIPAIGGLPESETVTQIPAVSSKPIVIDTPQAPTAPNQLEIATQTPIEENNVAIIQNAPVVDTPIPTAQNPLEIATQAPISETPIAITPTTPQLEIVEPVEDNLLNIVKPTE